MDPLVLGIIGFLGLLIDVDRPEGIGLSSLAWSTLAYAASRLAASVDLTDRIISSVVLGILVFLAEAIRAFVLSGINLEQFGLLLLRWALPTAVYTGIAVPILIATVLKIIGQPRWLRGGT